MANGNGNITLNLTKVHVYIGLIAQSFVILSASLGLMLGLGKIMVRNQVEEIWHGSLESEVGLIIDTKISDQEAQELEFTQKFREEALERLRALETVDQQREDRLRRIETKLDLLLERGVR